MNIQRFSAPTAREALALARAVFGEATLVLSNRQTADGVEISAAAEDDLLSASTPAAPRVETPLLVRATAAPAQAPAARATSSAPADGRSTQAQVQADTERLAMSTLSFQDYVRERMLRRQQEEAAQATGRAPQRPLSPPQPEPAHALPAAAALSAPVALPAAAMPVAPQAEATAARSVLPSADPRPLRPAATVAAPAAASAPAPDVLAAPATARQPVAATAARSAVGSPELAGHVLKELTAMKQLMEERFSTLAWLGQARLDPVQSQLMLRLVRAGYSAALARAVLSQIRIGLDLDATLRAVTAALEGMLTIDPAAPSMIDEGGIFALVGATGVGKTTTIAKLALQCARSYGAASVGLITLDTQRAGAHEQLRTFGRGVGIVAHLAHDRDALQEMLALLAAKQLVLIDTPGISPRDPRRHEMHELLNLPDLQRVLVLNAGAHGDTLDEMARAYKAGARPQAILSKLDEAAKLGPALDTLMRHRFALRGVTDGQRVPEDWHAPDAAELVRSSMHGDRLLPFDPAGADLDFYFSPAACAA